MTLKRFMRIIRSFAIMVVFALCVLGYFGHNTPLMLIGGFTAFLLISILTSDKKEEKEIDIIE